MAQSTSVLQQLKGVGEVLAKRMEKAGLDSFEKIAQGGEEALQKVPGMPPRSVATIVEQARQLAEQGRTEKEESLGQRLSRVREQLQTLAKMARDRFEADLAGKKGKKLTLDLVRIEDALARMADGGKVKRTGKALTKAQKRFSGLEDASLKKLRKHVKRARKTVIKAVR